MAEASGIRRGLRRFGGMPENEVDVAEAALLLAALGRPRAVLAPYRRHLESLTGEVLEYAGGEAGELDMRAEALRRVIGRRHGYGGGGDGLDVPESEGANLMQVIDDRHGLPGLLAIIYLDVAGRCGWTIEAIDFPVRTVVRLEGEGRRLMLDPVDGGRLVEPAGLRDLLKAVMGVHAELTPAHFRTLGKRELLLRIEQTVKMRFLRSDRLAEALEVVEASLLFAPDMAHLWREAGLLYARLDNVKAAVAALEEYMRRNSGDASRYRTSVLLQELRARLQVI